MKGWKMWLFVIMAIVVTLSSMTTAVANVKGVFNKDDDSTTTNSSNDSAYVQVVNYDAQAL